MSKSVQHQTLKLRNKLDELSTINGFLEKLADEWGMPISLTMTLNLVLEEAFTNVVNYAFDDDKEHLVEIVIEKYDDALVIKVIDDGKPFDPTKTSSPDISLSAQDRAIGGLGIFLIRKMMDDVSYQREAAKNILAMKKEIVPEPTH
jgi:serine/threonine-protein kinase RsbW